jgi:hypothetical protein
MAQRIRTIKPEFFRHEGLFDLERETGLPVRLAFIGLWTVCDRRGRFQWRPRSLKTVVLPFDDLDFSQLLDALERGHFVERYEVEGQVYGVVPGFSRHQIVNNREAESTLPSPPGHPVQDACDTHDSRVNDANGTRSLRDPHAPLGEGKGKEGKDSRKGKEHALCARCGDTGFRASLSKPGMRVYCECRSSQVETA